MTRATHTFATRFTLVVLVGSSLLSPISSSAVTAVEEGRIYQFAAGNEYEWNPEAGTYFLYVRAGPNGAVIDLSSLRTSDEPEQTLMAHGGYGIAVDFDGTHAQHLRVKSGDGRLVLARPDLTHRSLANPNENIQASGTLPAHACRAYYFSSTWMSKPYLVEGAGSGVRFVLFSRLDPIQGPSNPLSATLDPNKPEGFTQVVQACRDAEGTGAHRVWITYPAPEAASSLSQPFALLALGLSAAVVAAAVVLVGAFVWRRRRQRTGPTVKP